VAPRATSSSIEEKRVEPESDLPFDAASMRDRTAPASALGSALLITLACRGSDQTRVRLVGADGRIHYATYAATGEVTDSTGAVNIYSATGANALSPVAARAKRLVYVPNSRSHSVTVIDPTTYSVVRTFNTGEVPQHVVPSYDLKTLWVLNNSSSTLTPIDPFTGINGAPIHVDDPYNLYFSPDGR